MSDTTTTPTTANKLVAEALGTFLLVFGSIGAALFAADFGTGSNGSSLGIGFIVTSLAAATLLFAIEVKNRKHLADVMRRVRRTGVVSGVYRYPL